MVGIHLRQFKLKMKEFKEVETKRFSLNESTHTLLRRWAKAHLIDEDEIDNLPRIGLITTYQNSPIVVAFLREVEGHRCIIDSLMCDPESDLNIRLKALDQMGEALVEEAKFHHFKGIIGLTTNKRVMNRALKLGFQIQKHRLYSMTLKGQN